MPVAATECSSFSSSLAIAKHSFLTGNLRAKNSGTRHKYEVWGDMSRLACSHAQDESWKDYMRIAAWLRSGQSALNAYWVQVKAPKANH